MKLSVSLSDQDVEYLDVYERERQLPSRSAALQKAVRLLRASELGADHESAWDDWETSGEAVAWEPTVGDGVGDR